MEVVVLFHKEQICSGKNYDYASEVYVVVDRQEDKSGRYEELQRHIERRYGYVWHL